MWYSWLVYGSRGKKLLSKLWHRLTWFMQWVWRQPANRAVNRQTVAVRLPPSTVPRFHGSTAQPWNRAATAGLHGSTAQPWAGGHGWAVEPWSRAGAPPLPSKGCCGTKWATVGHGLNSTCLISCDGLFDSQGPKISLSITVGGGMGEQYLTTNGVKVKHTKYDQAYLSFVWSFVPMALAAWVFFLLLGQLRQGKLCPCESHPRKIKKACKNQQRHSPDCFLMLDKIVLRCWWYVFLFQNLLWFQKLVAQSLSHWKTPARRAARFGWNVCLIGRLLPWRGLRTHLVVSRRRKGLELSQILRVLPWNGMIPLLYVSGWGTISILWSTMTQKPRKKPILTWKGHWGMPRQTQLRWPLCAT